MPDEQEKSGDLIAELAKLMAVGGSEPEARPAPRPVQLQPAPAAPPRGDTPGGDVPAPAARPAGLRIPGFDQPVAPEVSKPAEAPVSAPARPAFPVPPPASGGATPQVSATPAPAIRIPGMDRPVPVPQREPTIDFGTVPPPVVPRPQPINDWQNREIPKPAVSRPTTIVEPEADRGAGQLPQQDAGSGSDAQPAGQTAQSASVRSEPDGLEHISFDFGLGDRTGSAPAAASLVKPAEVAPRPEPTPQASDSEAVAAAPQPKVQAGTGDPIADLIAAELDAGLSQPPAPPVAPVAAPSVEQAVPPQPAPATVPGTALGQRPMEPRPRTSAPIAGRPAIARPTIPSENDRFAVSPIFGPASKGGVEPAEPVNATPASKTPDPIPVVPSPPAPQGAPTTRQPPVERDPMDEIESLIGEAVRVELVQAERNAAARANAPGKTADVEPSVTLPAPAEPKADGKPQAPIVPPLTAGLPPRRAALKDAEPRVSADEAAALAAAASATAPQGKKAPRPPKPEPIPARPKPPRASRGMRQYVGMAVAGTLLLASGLGLYWVLTMNHGGSGDAPVLQADADPVKKEAPPQASTNNGQGSVVFNELEGKSDTSNEQLVSRDDSAETPIADVAEAEPATSSGSETELANRKVRTVTVRPDGSIVSGDEAGSEALPVDRPNVPTLPNATTDTQATDLLAAVQNGSDAANGGTSTTATTATPVDPAAQLAAIEPTPGNVINPNIVAPVPMPRVTDRSLLKGNSAGSTAATADAAPLDVSGAAPAASSGTPKVVSGGSGTYVQLSSQRSQDDAAAALRRTQQRLGSVVNGGALEIRRVDLGAKGIWYRVVLPTSSFQEATQACATIKANGGDCVAING